VVSGGGKVVKKKVSSSTEAGNAFFQKSGRRKIGPRHVRLEGRIIREGNRSLFSSGRSTQAYFTGEGDLNLKFGGKQRDTF